jgi:hypothetical protein
VIKRSAAPDVGKVLEEYLGKSPLVLPAILAFLVDA